MERSRTTNGGTHENRAVLTDLVRIDSRFPGEFEIGRYLLGSLSRAGFDVSVQHIESDRYNILAERGREPRSILFFGHMDTVGVYDGWRVNPFDLTVHGNRLYGLGAWDMKAGLTAILQAAKAANSRTGIKVLFTVDEENISKGAWTAVTETRDWFDDIKLAVSAEPPIARLTKKDSVELVTMGRAGRGLILIDVIGQSSHASRPERGINAIEEAAKIVSAIQRLPPRVHEILGPDVIFTRGITGGSLTYRSKTSFSVPDKARIEIEAIITQSLEGTKQRIESLLADMIHAEALTPGTQLKVSIRERKTPYLQPYVTDLNEPEVQRVLGILSGNGLVPRIVYPRSVSDENVVATLGIPVIRIGPRGDNAHSANEWVSEAALNLTTVIYKAIAEKY